MKTLIKFSIILLLATISIQAMAQNASAKIQELYNKYGNIPKYKMNVTYESVNEDMGFSNTQEGVLVVDGDRYIMKFGPNETWLDDGKTEYVGTKETDHSQIMYFCPGQNVEAIVPFGSMLTFYGSDHSGVVDGSRLVLKPSAEMPYVQLQVAFSGNNIESITAIDDFGTSHKYIFSNFSTTTTGTSFTINPGEYYEKIDERAGCK